MLNFPDFFLVRLNLLCPFSGVIRDASSTYSGSLSACAALQLSTALLWLLMPCAQRADQRRETRKEKEAEKDTLWRFRQDGVSKLNKLLPRLFHSPMHHQIIPSGVHPQLCELRLHFPHIPQNSDRVVHKLYSIECFDCKKVLIDLHPFEPKVFAIESA